MTERLENYRKKRDFTKTAEPKGKVKSSKKSKLRFVIQHHMARREHFDLRLEWQGVLLSWAVPKGLSNNPRDKRLAVEVEPHPIEYRNFEGTIKKGEYGGGTVMLFDEGYWQPLGDAENGLKEGNLKFELFGKRLVGKWALIRLKAKKGDKNVNWIVLKEKDEYARDDDDISNASFSIRTGRTMEEIEKNLPPRSLKNPFTNAEVQLVKLAARAESGDNWLYEIKYDGYRILAFIEENKARLITRNGNDLTSSFKEIADALIKWAAGRAAVIDGEVVIIDSDGKTDFQALQNYIKKPDGKSLTYIAFDILAYGGEDLRNYPLIDRKNKLEELLKTAPKNIYYSRHIIGGWKENLHAACRLNLEGIVGKKTNSVYSGTRNGDWIKLKCVKRQEFVIGGYTLTDKKNSGVSSLLLGYYKGSELIYAGRVGTGINAAEMLELEKTFKKITRKNSPFKSDLKARYNENITWLRPVTVAEIQFADWTDDNVLRQASYKGLRLDKNAKEVVLETDIKDKGDMDKTSKNRKGKAEKVSSDEKTVGISVCGVAISSPDKVIFEKPPTTKLDIAVYYEGIAEYMLPFLEKRILSVVRCPKGASGECFFKKHISADKEGVKAVSVNSGSGVLHDYFYIENKSGLISQVQMGTIEFHTWGSRAESFDNPDIMVFDLDPDENMEIRQVRQGVKDLKDILDKLSLKSFLKTSGGKGYHIVVPFKPTADWDTFSDFAKRIAQLMERKWQDRYTSNMRKEKRKGKIFIDWVRNGRGATSIAPYSLRAREGGGVSMPIEWEKLNKTAPDSYNINNALQKAKKSNPWKDFYKCNQQLK